MGTFPSCLMELGLRGHVYSSQVMQLLLFPGYHSPDLTLAFSRCLRRQVACRQLQVWPIEHGAFTWMFHRPRLQHADELLQIIAFSAGVVAAYPVALSWLQQGGRVQFIAMDGWGMPLLGGGSIYRMSHDRYTHLTTYLPSPLESEGYFYADPAVDHLSFWRSPHAVCGVGRLAGVVKPMTALDFIAASLAQKV